MVAGLVSAEIVYYGHITFWVMISMLKKWISLSETTPDV